MALHHIDTSNRGVGPKKGRIHKTDDPKEFVKTYTVVEEIDLGRLESDLADLQAIKALKDPAPVIAAIIIIIENAIAGE